MSDSKVPPGSGAWRNAPTIPPAPRTPSRLALEIPRPGERHSVSNLAAVTAQPTAPAAPQPPPSSVPDSSRLPERNRSSTPPPPPLSRSSRSGEYPALGNIRKDSPRPPKLDVDFGLITPASRVIDELLGVAAGEQVVLLADEGNRDVMIALEAACIDRGAKPFRVDLDAEYRRPITALPNEILVRLRNAQVSLLAVRPEEGEFGFRTAVISAAAQARLRHLHMVGMSRHAFLRCMSVPCSRVADLTRALRSAMRPNSRFVVKSSAGTLLEVSMAPHLRWFGNSGTVRSGEWGTVPFGALSTTPANVNGVYVVDAAMSGALGIRRGLLTGRPIRLTFDSGRVRRVECGDAEIREYVERFIGEGGNRDRVGLLNLGAHVGLQSPLGEISHDENIPGLHLALGETCASSTGATWSASGQLAFAMSCADVDLDAAPLIRQGRYVRFV